MPASPTPPRLALLAAWVVLFASSPARGADYAVRLTGDAQFLEVRAALARPCP